MEEIGLKKNKIGKLYKVVYKLINGRGLWIVIFGYDLFLLSI